MRKENFLYEIRQGACVKGSRASMAWEAAQSISEDDGRWRAVEEHDAIETFARAFEVALPEIARRRRSPISELDRLTKRLADAEKVLVSLSPDSPFREDAIRHIEWIKEKIKKEESEENI